MKLIDCAIKIFILLVIICNLLSCESKFNTSLINRAFYIDTLIFIDEDIRPCFVFPSIIFEKKYIKLPSLYKYGITNKECKFKFNNYNDSLFWKIYPSHDTIIGIEFLENFDKTNQISIKNEIFNGYHKLEFYTEWNTDIERYLLKMRIKSNKLYVVCTMITGDFKNEDELLEFSNYLIKISNGEVDY